MAAPPAIAGRLTPRLFGERRPPLPLLLAGIAAALAAALPAAYLLIVLAGDLGAVGDEVFTSRTAGLLARTVGLAAAVTVTAVAIALPLAWLTARTDLPGRRIWATLVTLPLVVPSYIGAYLLVSAFGPRGFLQDALAPLGIEQIPSIYGWPGAWLALSLFTYPLVLLPARAALMRLDPQLEDAARALGRGPRGVFTGVILPQLRPAIAAGGLLVALYVLSDFGAVAIMRFDSFTREIYVSYAYDRTGAAALGAVLVVLMVVLLFTQARIRGAGAYHRSSPGSARIARTVPLGRWRWPALGFCGLVTLVALILPVGVLVYWAAKGLGDADAASITSYAGNSLLAGALAAVVAAAAAIVIAVLVVRHRGLVSALIERAGYAGYALPGIVVALAIVFIGTRVAPALYQTLGMLIFALAAHYLPLAIGPSTASLLQVSPRVEEAARGLGRGPLEVFRTITAPLALSGVLAGAGLVFLHAVKELPATLLLAPIGFETLATDIWRQTSSGFFEAGAVPALVLLLVAAPPLYLLSSRGTVSS